MSSLESIQDFGSMATRVSIWETEPFEQLQNFYDTINPARNPEINQAIMLELNERGVLPVLRITDMEGTLHFEPAEPSAAEREEVELRNAIKQLSADQITRSSQLTNSGEDNQMSLDDIESALRNPASVEQQMALQYLREHFDDITDDGWLDGDDIGLEELTEFAEERGVSRDELLNLEQETTERQTELLADASSPLAETEGEPQDLPLRPIPPDAETPETVPPEGDPQDTPPVGPQTESETDVPADQEEPGRATYEIRGGDGFDRIARTVYLDTYGRLPSIQQEINLSARIAELNDNDRRYSGGAIHPGQTLRVLDRDELDEFFAG